jgi:hypothetical protein
MNPPRRPDDGAHGAPYPTRMIIAAAHRVRFTFPYHCRGTSRSMRVSIGRAAPADDGDESATAAG